jgi:1,5-anhydro-D-fructose reductase (1,5-anhydro-D-mannitol-forming)
MSHKMAITSTAGPVLRWGILGCGDVCEVKSGPAFYKCDNSALVAIMRRNKDKAVSFAERHNVDRVYSSGYKELIQDSQVDCIYVATPPGVDRISIARSIAEANKPCYMEKPLGRDFVEAQDIVDIFRDAGVPLYCAYYRRYMPKFVAAREGLSQIGQATSVSVVLSLPLHDPDKDKDKAHWHYDRSVSGGGMLLDMGCHMLDIVVSYFTNSNNSTDSTSNNFALVFPQQGSFPWSDSRLLRDSGSDNS